MLRKVKQVYYFACGYWIAVACKSMPKKRVKTRQKKRFKTLISYVSDKSEFYRNVKKQEFSDIPIIEKSDFLENFDSINTVGLNLKECESHGLKAERERDFKPELRGVSVGLSSGTSLQRGVFLVSPYEQALWAGYIIAKNIPFSLSKKRVALFLRSNNNLYESANGLFISFKFFDLTKPLAQLISELETFNPHILIAPAHVLGIIAKNSAAIQPEKIISVAEVLENDVRDSIEEKYGCRVDEIYQATEGCIAVSCSHGSLHLNEDILIVEKEWVDKESGRFIPVITDLNRTTLPVIRYRLNDILIEDKTPCSCGSHFTRIKSIEGREDDILWLHHENGGQLTPIFPDVLRRAMLICESTLSDYRIEQRGEILDIAYESMDCGRAEKEIAATLHALFNGAEVQIPTLRFSVGVTQDMTKKMRRIACYQKP